MYNYLVEIVYLFMKPFFFIYMYFHVYFPWSKVVCKRIRKAGISLVGDLLKNVHGIAICPEMHALMKMTKIRQNLQWSSELISLCRIWLKFFKIVISAMLVSHRRIWLKSARIVKSINIHSVRQILVKSAIFVTACISGQKRASALLLILSFLFLPFFFVKYSFLLSFFPQGQSTVQYEFLKGVFENKWAKIFFRINYMLVNSKKFLSFSLNCDETLREWTGQSMKLFLVYSTDLALKVTVCIRWQNLLELFFFFYVGFCFVLLSFFCRYLLVYFLFSFVLFLFLFLLFCDMVYKKGTPF